MIAVRTIINLACIAVSLNMLCDKRDGLFGRGLRRRGRHARRHQLHTLRYTSERAETQIRLGALVRESVYGVDILVWAIERDIKGVFPGITVD
jgi:hypothetical protein